MTKLEGRCGFFTPYVWMFIQSYEKLRQYLYSQATLETLIQFEYSAFEEATVPVCTFTFAKRHVNKKGNYLRLVNFRGGMEVQRQKTLETIANHNCGFYYEQSTDNFAKIPGSPVAYWVSAEIYQEYVKGLLKNRATTKQGFKTGDNERFLRFWFEPSIEKESLYYKIEGRKWYPCTKGGDFRRWYGNLEYVVDWEEDGFRIKHFVDEKGKLRSRPQNLQINFHPAISWSSISSSKIHFRKCGNQVMYESKGPVLLPVDNIDYVLGYVNTKVYQSFIDIVAPTLDYSEGAVLKVPYKYDEKNAEQICTVSASCTNLSKDDWDAFENSWNFKKHPLV